MAPSTKKQKTSDAPPTPPPPPPPALVSLPAPISFGRTADHSSLSIMVFDQQYLCHSQFLRTHSEFFRRILSTNRGGTFDRKDRLSVRYYFVTKLTSPHTWELCLRPMEGVFDLSAFKGDIVHDQEAFHNVLKALYYQPYIIKSVAQLETMVDIAQRLNLLPILSRSFDSVIWRSYAFIDEMPKHGRKLLNLAYKLRNHLLFRDALCHAAGAWGPAADNTVLDNPELIRIVDKERIQISIMVSEAQSKVTEIIANEESTEEKRGVNEVKLWKITKGGSYPGTPSWARQVFETGIYDCSELLRSNLLTDNGFNKAGVDECKDRFLCAWIDTADLPWDLTQIDWV
ncbi:uncharacterized protein LY89DRAFT_776647 [Mollisia scopiformis]|uniref:BTB domain-containing protein n=1 Tax=Mollisia scopiformis TaxID=149040 RepID=A0A194XWX0_MOLSC|nr:uncharacterized protein LY89DRAFT_776647 [Mollisia scopiformis]KUJ24554.1 hypothetical protein LY89DRAFT_776647 [Mollisia scopiformis]